MNTLLTRFATAALVAITLVACDILDPETPGLLVPPTVDEDPSLPYITVNGTRLHAETFGDPTNPILVVLHGGPGEDYRSLLNCSRFAADGYFVVFYDQRGCGLSRRHNKEVFTGPQLFVDDLRAVIGHYRQRPDQPVILMGKSWGAMLATAYVNEYPDEIRGLVLMEPGGFTWHDAEAYAKRARRLDLLDETSNDFLFVDQILTAHDHNELDYKAALQAGANWSAGNPIGNAGPYPIWRKGAVCAQASMEYARDHGFDFTTELRRFTPTVLFLYSELSEAYGRTHATLVSSAYAHVQLVEIKGTGHEIPYFGWDRFYPVAKAYLATIR